MGRKPVAKPPMDPDLMTGEQVCELLQITPRHLRNLCESGRIPRVMIGRRMTRFNRPAILSWLEENVRDAG